MILKLGESQDFIEQKHSDSEELEEAIYDLMIEIRHLKETITQIRKEKDELMREVSKDQDEQDVSILTRDESIARERRLGELKTEERSHPNMEQFMELMDQLLKLTEEMRSTNE